MDKGINLRKEKLELDFSLLYRIHMETVCLRPVPFFEF